MTHVVTGNCQGCRYTDCVQVCPVDCFHEDAEQLFINPDECIDCGACVAECPVEAIYSEDEIPEDQLAFLELGAERWSNCEIITEMTDPLPTADAKRNSLGF